MSWLVNAVKRFEGYREEAYQDSVGVWTIGYGNTRDASGEPIRPGDTITTEEAEKLLQDELEEFLDYVIRFSDSNDYGWNKNQIGALTSFVYNLGKSRLKQVTGNATRDNETIAKKMRLYNKAGGRTLKGLVARINEEADHFLS